MYYGTCDEEKETLRRFLSRSDMGMKQKKIETGPPTVLVHMQQTRCTSARNEKNYHSHVYMQFIFNSLYNDNNYNDKNI